MLPTIRGIYSAYKLQLITKLVVIIFEVWSLPEYTNPIAKIVVGTLKESLYKIVIMHN